MDIETKLKWLNFNSWYGLYPRRNTILIPDYEEEKEVKDAIVAKPKCMYCEFATLNVTDPPCLDCYFTTNRPNFKPNESCKQLYSKIKEGMNESNSDNS